MSKKTLLNFILVSAIIAIIYGIWAIQPLGHDDWRYAGTHHALFIPPPLPETGQAIRYIFNASHFLPIGPFSLFRPWSLFTAIVLTSLFWAALIQEPILIRAGLTLLVLLGFPYLGHIGAWNLAASMYTVSAAWMMLWYALLRKIRYVDKQFILKGISFFILTFIAASWHEVWLITFAAIVIYFLFDAFSLVHKRDKSFKLRSLSIHLSIILAYICAVAFYTRGGPNRFIDTRIGDQPGHFISLCNWSYVIKAFLLGTKESLVLIKDSLPVFLLIIYIKLNKNFKTKLSSDFRLFLAAALGSILFMYVVSLVLGPPDWRARWLCVLSLSVAFYALPKSNLIDRFSITRSDSFIRAVRFFSIIAAVIWLSYNAYFTYVYTNIDVVKWLQFRQMVLDRNPAVMKNLGGCTLPKNRLKGIAYWDHPWGVQDNKYRIFCGPEEYWIHKAINDVWNDQSVKK